MATATDNPPARDRAPAPRRRWGLRVALGCLVVLLCAGGIGALLVRHQLETLRIGLSENPSLRIDPGTLAPAGFGDPQTILLVGNDQRKHTTTTPVLPHSNEMLLVRIDPGKPWISLMSIPRELWVPVQTRSGPVTTRLNAELFYGGINGLVSTIKADFGLRVNHVVVIDFDHFVKAVDDLGCIYSTVDRRYFHVNVPGGQQYFEVNLQPGYQRLCGSQALQFVSYRHDDSSTVRDARDQQFLLDARRQLSPTLVDNVARYERIFGETVSTDPTLHTDTGILNLIGTAISSASKPVRRVQFQSSLLPNGDLTASPQQTRASVHSFLHGSGRAPTTHTAAVARSLRHRNASRRLSLAPATAAELAGARRAAQKLPFPLEYPRVKDALSGSGPVDMSGCPADPPPVTCLRTYLIHGPSGAVHPAYVVVQSAGLIGQYYDVQGTTWTGAPQLADPAQTITVGGRAYDLYYEGSHLNMVAWREHGAVYWIRNTLVDALSNGAMLAIAEQTTPVAPVGGSAYRGPSAVRLRLAHLPAARGAAPAPVGALRRYGGLAGLAALIGLPLLLGAIVLRRRRLVALRREVADLEGRAERLVAITSAALRAPGRMRQARPPAAPAPAAPSGASPQPADLPAPGRHPVLR